MCDKRKKLLISLLIFISGLVANIYFSSALHLILSKEMRALKILPIEECVRSIITVKQHMVLFLCLQGFAALLGILYFAVNNKPYQSALSMITPQIKTPVPAGQKQHGSAEWLTEKEKDTVFNQAAISLSSRFIKNLISEGCSDINEIVKTDKEALKDYKKKEKVERRESTTIVYAASNGLVKGEELHELEKSPSYLSQGGVILRLNQWQKGRKYTLSEMMYIPFALEQHAPGNQERSSCSLSAPSALQLRA